MIAVVAVAAVATVVVHPFRFPDLIRSIVPDRTGERNRASIAGHRTSIPERSVPFVAISFVASYMWRRRVGRSMAIDVSTVQRINGTIGLSVLKTIATVARAARGELTRPYPIPGYEYVPANPTEKDSELS